jgi:hypothetical protein
VGEFVRRVGWPENLLVLEDRFAGEEVVEQSLAVVFVVEDDFVEAYCRVSARVGRGARS